MQNLVEEVLIVIRVFSCIYKDAAPMFTKLSSCQGQLNR